MYCINYEEGCRDKPCTEVCDKCKGIIKVEIKEDDTNTNK